MRSHRFSFMQLQEGSCHLNCHVPLSPFNQVISFYLNSIKEMLMTQADRFSQEEVRNFIQNRNPAQLLFSTKSLPLFKCMNLAEIQPERRLMPALAIRNNSKHLFWRAPWLNQSHTDSLDSHPSASVAYLVLLLPMEGSWALDLLESKWIWVGTVFWFPFLWVGLKSGLVVCVRLSMDSAGWEELRGLYFQKRRWSGAGLWTEQTGLDIYPPGLTWVSGKALFNRNLWDSSRTLLTSHVPTLVSTLPSPRKTSPWWLKDQGSRELSWV